MKWQGSIDFQKPIKIDGKPHGIEHEATLPAWEAGSVGRTIHSEDDNKLWFGETAGWSELTPGGVGAHSHDDVYYTETEIDGFFEGEDGGKKQVSFNNVTDKPSLYNPTVHSNTSHSEVYLVAADVTFEQLQTNGDVGIASNQLAIGSHNHDTAYSAIDHDHDLDYAALTHYHHDVYYTKTDLQNTGVAQVNYANLTSVPTEFTPAAHTHLEANITDLDKYTQAEVTGFLAGKSDTGHDHNTDYYTKTNIQTSGEASIHWDNLSNIPTSFTPSAHSHDDLYYTETEVDTALGLKSDSDHIHTSLVITYDNTDSGMTATNVKAAIDELDTAIEGLNLSAATYEALSAIGDIGTGADQVAQGDHTHDDLYYTETEVDTALGLKADSTHSHDDVYYTETEVDTKFSEILVPSTTGGPVDTPAANTVRFDASTNTLYIYNGSSWVSTILS